MRYKKLFILPAVLILVFIITSIVAFNTTDKLNSGYVFIDEGEEVIEFDGAYFLLIGNLGQDVMFVTLTDVTDGVNLKLFDTDKVLLKEYVIEMNVVGETFDQNMIVSMDDTEYIPVDNIEEHLLVVELDSTEEYHLDVRTIADIDNDRIDVLLTNLPEQLINMKSLMETVSFTTLVFSIISFFTVVAIMYVKRD